MYFSKVLAVDIIKYAVSKGANKIKICEDLGIDINKTIDQNETISYGEMVSILLITGKMIDDEYLGLHMGEQLMLNATKQVDEIMLNSPTIEVAFNNANDYSRLISDALQGSIEKTEHYTKVIFEINPNWEVLQNQAVRQIIDLTLVCTIKSIYWLTGRMYSPLEIHLPYSSAKKRSEYYRVFDCGIRFKQKAVAAIFPNPILDISVPTKNIGLLADLKKIGDEEIEKLQTECSLILEIKKSVLSKLPQRATVQLVAHQQQMSSRTMQRRLRELSTNFKKIEKEILMNLAQTFILFEERNIDEVSYLLGFSEASAFIRFFKNEMNITPVEFKKKMLNKVKVDE